VASSVTDFVKWADYIISYQSQATESNFVIAKLYNCLELVRIPTAAFTSGPDQMPCVRKLLLIGQNFHVGKFQEVKQTLKKSTLAR
ncbi:hypothetical protein P3382_26925, partial [Vibrio parahaemolyticus]|nr:hypothetical protein [Vibrio parahaemolyticus]